MRLLLIGLAASLAFAGISCDAGKSCRCDYDSSGRPIVLFDDFNDMPLINDPADILEIGIQGDILHLTVGFSGCTPNHDFALYGLRGFMESNPVQAGVRLSHDGKGETCDAYITRFLEFDLSPLKDEYRHQYGPHGPIRLRICEPGSRDPVEPLPVYYF
jgi:hypothetical protein